MADEDVLLAGRGFSLEPESEVVEVVDEVRAVRATYKKQLQDQRDREFREAAERRREADRQTAEKAREVEIRAYLDEIDAWTKEATDLQAEGDAIDRPYFESTHAKMALGEPDASGRRRPEPVPGSEFVIECDTVIPAIGQDPDLSFIPPDMGIDITKWNTVVTRYIPFKDAAGKDLKDGMGNMQSRTLITDCEGVFAGGDAEIGPLTVVACIGSGHRAAKVIQRWLEEGRAYLTDDELMEDILNYLGVYDKNESVPWLDSAKREHQAEVHGRVRASLTEGLDEARATMDTLERVGISMGEVTGRLLKEGVQLFAEPFDKLLAAVDQRR